VVAHFVAALVAAGESGGGMEGVAIFVFELDEVVASCLGDGLWLDIIERAASNRSYFQIDFCVEL
jgi:hypothetical protein